VTYCNGYKCVAGSGCQQTCAAATDCDASQGYACAGGLCVKNDGGSGGTGGASGTGGGGTAGPSPATAAGDSSSKGGCGCRVPGQRGDGRVVALGLLLAGAMFARARRRRVRWPRRLSNRAP
jgi:MYXO-CTERM domain-containing protein